MMWWNGSGWGWGLAILGMIMCVAMMAMMMNHGGSRRASPPYIPPADPPKRADTPENILAKRLATGEIDVEEYQRLRDTLRHPDGAQPETTEPERVDRQSPTA